MNKFISKNCNYFNIYIFKLNYFILFQKKF